MAGATGPTTGPWGTSNHPGQWPAGLGLSPKPLLFFLLFFHPIVDLCFNFLNRQQTTEIWRRDPSVQTKVSTRIFNIQGGDPEIFTSIKSGNFLPILFSSLASTAEGLHTITGPSHFRQPLNGCYLSVVADCVSLFPMVIPRMHH